MGKKVGKKREREEEEDIEIEADLELEAELAALRSIEEEKELNDRLEDTSKAATYNVQALLQSIENVGIDSLSFIETMQISGPAIEIVDEHDDLAREVLLFSSFL
jgi:hypothetical protein